MKKYPHDQMNPYRTPLLRLVSTLLMIAGFVISSGSGTLAIPKSATPVNSVEETTPLSSNAKFDITTDVNTLKKREKTRINKGFGPHKLNYVLPLCWTPPIDGRLEKEVKFQFSVKQRIIEAFRYTLFLGYTQKSFWQVYDKKNSSPFRETNYNPEIFIRSPEFETRYGIVKGDVGYEHESNGTKLPLSRSWDRIFAKIALKMGAWNVGVKMWNRIPERKKNDLNDTQGDDNPDIHKYYGNSEYTIQFHNGGTLLSVMIRHNFGEKQGGHRIDLSYPIPGVSMFWHAQYWNGYGESLIDYNRGIQRVGIGVILNR